MTFLAFASVDGGKTFAAISTANITTSQSSAIDIVGISPTDPTVVYARSSAENGVSGDGIYKSVDSGATWTPLLHADISLSFVARGDGSLVVAGQTAFAIGTQMATMFVSADRGATWTPIAAAPHANCVVENAAGEVWACTQNFGSPGVQADGYAIMKSTDLQTWTGVLRFQDIAGPVQCPAGTAQQDVCVATSPGKTSMWCDLRCQLGITSTVDPDCAPCIALDASGADLTIARGTKKGCCDAGGSSTSLLVGLVVAIVLSRRRRARRVV
jgi:hypothetical protein